MQTKKTVLLIEDNPVITGIYRNRLMAEGFDVKTAKDGETGLEMLRKLEPDAVLLDLMLPKVSGIDFLKTVRAEEKFKVLPVVVLSTVSGTDLIEKACSAGATQCLSKYTCQPKQVADVLRSVLPDKADPAGGILFTTTVQTLSSASGGSSVAVASPPSPPPATVKPATEAPARRAGAKNKPATPTRTWEIPEMEVPPGPSILLLEDNDGMADLLKIFLESQAFQVTRVSGGGDGLRQILRREFDAILCDMVMPNMPGDLFYLAVQRTKPHLCKRFIFMTGHFSDKKWDKFVAKVQCVMLWKPFQLAALLTAIREVMEKTAEAEPVARR